MSRKMTIEFTEREAEELTAALDRLVIEYEDRSESESIGHSLAAAQRAYDKVMDARREAAR